MAGGKFTFAEPGILVLDPGMHADEFQQITEDVFFWQAYAAAVKSDLSCCARRCADGLVFIDPIALAPAALDELIQIAAPTAIVLTNGNHARSAATYRAKFGIPICAHVDAVAELGIEVDQTFTDEATLLGSFEVVALEGGPAGEVALVADGCVHFGDAVIHLEPHGLRVLPDKYSRDQAALRTALQKLLPFDFELMTFAHGLPVPAHAQRRLASILA
ncbi:MAG TPA: hypothetical protein VF593_07815 [Chthoniobacteraceae bacterium]